MIILKALEKAVEWILHDKYSPVRFICRSIIDPVRDVSTEIITNWLRMYRLANYDLKAKNKGTFFGFLWNFLNPALQIFVYWFVFAIGLRVTSPMEGVPYVIWMIVGIIPWFSISTAIMSASTSIIVSGNIIKTLKFPLAIIPTKAVISNTISNLWAMLIVLIIVLFSGTGFTWHILQLPYYIVCTTLLLTGISLITSSITVIIRDFTPVLNAVMRLLFYVTPVLWATDSLAPQLLFIMKLNPFYYLINGYRESILWGVAIWEHPAQTAYFWLLTIFAYVLGCVMHTRLRRKFIDLI